MEVYASCASERSDTRKNLKVISYKKDGVEGIGTKLDRVKKLNTFYQIPNFLFFIIPITFGFTILSSNVGRMLLSSFPIVIPYALIGINYLFQKKTPTILR